MGDSDRFRDGNATMKELSEGLNVMSKKLVRHGSSSRLSSGMDIKETDFCYIS